MAGEFLGGAEAGLDGDGADGVGAGGVDVVGVIADEPEAGAGCDPTLAAGVGEGERGEGGAGAAHFGEGAEGEIGAEAGAFHFSPGDAGEVAGDESGGDALAAEAAEESFGAGADAGVEVAWGGAEVDALRFGHEGRHGAADGGGAETGAVEHGGEDVAVEHALDGDAVGGAGVAGDAQGGGFESLPVMRPRAANQRAINIEQDNGGGH